MSDVDLPDDFFDDFTKTDFLEGLEVSTKAEPSNLSDDDGEVDDDGDESNQEGIREKQDSVLREIQRLERDIAARKKKIKSFHDRSRSRSPPSKRRRSTSRPPRIRRRSRSRGRSHRSPQDRRHDRKRSRSRSGSRNMRSRSRQNSTGRSITFLEELAQKFAKEGKPFPEAEALQNNKMSPHGYPIPMGGGMGMPMGNVGGPVPMPPGMMFPNPMVMGGVGPQHPMDFGMPYGFVSPAAPIGYPTNLYPVQAPIEQMIIPPAPNVSMDLTEYVSFSCFYFTLNMVALNYFGFWVLCRIKV